MGRREVTTAVTMLVLCGLLVAAAVVGWRELFAEIPAEETATEPAPSCTTQTIDAGQKVRASQVRVSVFNAGSRSGLADETMAALRKRGFKRGTVGNAPSDAQVKRVAVWSTVEGDVEARLVAQQLGDSVEVTFADADLGPGVDVIVGNGFRGLVRAKRSLTVKSQQEVCVPTPSSDATADTNAAG